MSHAITTGSAVAHTRPRILGQGSPTLGIGSIQFADITISAPGSFSQVEHMTVTTKRLIFDDFQGALNGSSFMVKRMGEAWSVSLVKDVPGIPSSASEKMIEAGRKAYEDFGFPSSCPQVISAIFEAMTKAQ